MSGRARAAIAAWLLLLGLCVWVVWRTPLIFDLTAFLPKTRTPVQQLLMEQLRSGVAARLMLVAVAGDDSQALAQISRDMAKTLRASGLFSTVNNGDAQSFTAEREFLLRHRYLLSPAVTAQHFSAEGLRQALQNDLERLASPAATLIKPTLAQDPTGEWLRLIAGTGANAPASRHGVWFSRDGEKTLLIAETKAAGFDPEAQNRAYETVKQAYAQAQPRSGMQLMLTGPGVFSVQSRAIIERDSWRLTLLAAALAFGVLFAVYRSFAVLALGLLPVASGLLAGVAVVGLVFGMVHGITLGFAATLIGEAVDYPSYLFTHVAKGEHVADTLRRIWPTLRLAVLTTVFGGLTMLFSSFTGLSQLGLLSMTGVLAAGAVTRWVLPELAPRDFTPRQIRAAARLDRLRASRMGVALVWAALLAACALLVLKRETMWDDDVANLSPIPEAAKQLDKELRAELGAPDLRYLVMVSGRERETVLQASERAAVKLQTLVDAQIISGFEGAYQFLPSNETQRERQSALPEAAVLQKNLNDATRRLPFREDLFAPFLRDVEVARLSPLIEERDLQGTAFALKVRSLLLQNEEEWVALLPLRGVEDTAKLAAQFQESNPEIALLDLKEESNRMINGYRNEALRLTGMGILAITLLLIWGLRPLRRVWGVLRPVLAAIVMTVGALALLGERLNLFHLVSLLLVLGIGLNYALFFNRDAGGADELARTHLSLLVCGLTTLSAFGCLAFSQTPVLHAIGLTVSLGCVLSLLVSGVWVRR